MKILVVGPSWVGDMVMTQSLFMLLQKQYPDCIIDVVAPSWSEPILARMLQVRKSISLPFKSGDFAPFKRLNFGKQLRSEKYDLAITLPRSWKSALVPLGAKISERVGFLGEQRYGLLTDWRKIDKETLDQTVKKFTFLGLPKGQELKPEDISYPQLQVNWDAKDELYRKFNLLDLPAVALMPGAEYGPAKQWPIEYYQELADKLALAGKQVWILGSNKDKPAGDLIASSNHPNIFNLCGKTQLAEVVDLLAFAEKAITNDSGLMHIAAAVNTEVVAIYGSSSPNYTPPLTDKKTIHWLELDCSPCFKKVCPLGHTDCLTKISVDRVLQGL